MNELEGDYSGKVDFKEIDVTTEAGGCDFQKNGFRAYPAMVYIDKHGNIVDKTQEFQTLDQLHQRLDDLLNG